jgi:hypothetical protein
MGGADSNPDEGLGITVDGSGNVFTTGYFRQVADFDPGTGTSNLSAHSGDDIFLWKLTGPGGNPIDITVTNLLLETSWRQPSATWPPRPLQGTSRSPTGAS